jgi:hypothetical protein
MRTFQQGEEKLNVTDKAIRVLIAIGIIGIINCLMDISEGIRESEIHIPREQLRKNCFP